MSIHKLSKHASRWRGMLPAIFFSCCFSAASAQTTYTMNADDPLITIVSPTGDTQLTSNCTWVVTDEGNDNNLPENNRAFWSKGDYLGTLIDGSASTYWHSDPHGMDLTQQDEWIQIDLRRDTIRGFCLKIMRREDVYNGTTRYGVTPVRLEIKATNTPSDEKSWKTVATLTDIKPAATSGVWPYYGGVDMGAAYRYVRLYCRQAATNSGESLPYWTFSELQVYPAVVHTDMRSVLRAVVDSIYDSNQSYVVGTGPGCVPQEAYSNFVNTFGTALDVNDNAKLTQEEYAQAVADLRQACEALNASIIALKDGWYFVRSAYAGFYDKTGSYRNMCGSSDGMVHWAVASEDDPTQYFIVKTLDDGNYSIFNAYTRQYVNTGAGNAYNSSGTRLYLSGNPESGQILTPTDGGAYYFSNTGNALPYHPLDHKNGSGTSGYVVPASVYGEISTWRLVAADSAKFASVAGDFQSKVDAENLERELAPVLLQIMDIKSPAPASGLITSGSQLSTNCAWNESYKNMSLVLDGNHSTYFHSDPSGMNLFNQDEWMQADLGRDDVTSFTLEYWGRNDGAASGNAWHDSPNRILVKATNTPDDESSWTEITTLDKYFPENVDDAHYVSLPITTATPYRYYRFYIKGTTSNNPYWNVSEFQLYDKVTASDASPYSSIAEVKRIVDEIDAYIALSIDHINNLTVDGTEMDSINARLERLQSALNYQQTLSDVISEAIALNDKLYTWSADGLIKEVNTDDDGTNQLWANATWKNIGPDNDNYSYNEAFIKDGYNLLGALIDKDDQTYWHSDPVGGNNLYTQENYLQIDLKQADVESFRIRIDRRNDLYQGSNRHGVPPSKAILYGTNDASIGTDVNGSCSNWEEITTLTDFPADKNDASLWPYVSGLITPATPYRYLRFRVTEDTDGQPYWCVSGFQILPNDESAYDPVASQYLRVEGMKDAADKMMATVSAVQKKLDDGTATISDTTEIKAAMADVLALYQDTIVLNELIARAEFVAANATTGSGIGYVPDQQLIDNLKNAISAAQGVKLASSTAEFNEKQQALEDAYEALQAAVPSVEEGKWYYILSADKASDKASANLYPARTIRGAAVYALNNGNGVYGSLIGSFNPETQLRWGLDDRKGISYEGDAEAMWHFVAAPASLGKRVYYIQNLRSGLYMGTANTANADYYVNAGLTPKPYRIDYIGGGQFNIVPVSGSRAGTAISFGDNARQVRADDIALALSNRAALTFQETAADLTQLNLKFAGNSMAVCTFPFAVSGLEANGENVKAYGIHSLVDATHVGLVRKYEFAAGEPMLLLLGDTTSAAVDTASVIINVPATDLTMQGDTVNGFVGTISATTLSGAGCGYVSGNQLHAVTGNPVSLPTYSGYIDPAGVVSMDGDPDAVLAVSGEGAVSGVAKILARSVQSAAVNVYTIDGQLVRRGVKPAEATKGLRKGIYIVGKRKVIVK